MLNQYFDFIMCISLKDREDRRLAFNNQAKKIGFTFEYFDAIKPESGNDKVNRGNLGCLRSHREVLKIAKASGAKKILILEDDCQFRSELIKEFKAGMDSGVDYDLLFLGGSLWLANQKSGSIKPFDKHFHTGTDILCTHAYSIKPEKIDELLDILNFETAPVDVRFIEFQNKNKTLIFKRNFAIQAPGFSDIQEKHANYHLMKN